MTDTDPQIVAIPQSTAKSGLLLFFCALFTALCLFFFVVMDEYDLDKTALIIMVAVVLAFFGGGGVFLAYRLFKPRPALLLTPEGLMETASALGAGLVPWEDIEEIFAYTFSGQRFLGIRVRDPQALFSRVGPVKRLLMRINKRMVNASINISQVALTMTVDELLELIHEYRAGL